MWGCWTRTVTVQEDDGGIDLIVFPGAVTGLGEGAGDWAQSVREGQVHVGGVIEDAAAVGAAMYFLLGLAGDDDLHGQFHVATAADAAVDPDDGIGSLEFADTLVTPEGDLINAAGELGVIGLEFGQFLLQGILPDLEGGELFGRGFGDFGMGLDRLADLGPGGLGLFHELELAVFQVADGFFAGLDFVGEGAVFLVFAGLELLDGIFVDLLFFGFGFQLEFASFGFDFFEVGPGSIEGGLGLADTMLDGPAFRVDVVEFGLDPENFAVAIL
jgi:hypothetical protein